MTLLELDDHTWREIEREFGRFELNKTSLEMLSLAGWSPAATILDIEAEIRSSR